MPVYYLDTSALLKRYRTEDGSIIVNELLGAKHVDDVYVTSYFTALEVEAVAARAVKGRVLSRDAHRALLSRFAQDLGDTILVQPISNSVIADSIDLTRRYALRAADAIQLATASRVKLAATLQNVFVASDKELLDCAKREGFSLLDPQHPEALEHLRRLRQEL